MPDRSIALADAASRFLPHTGPAKLIHRVLESSQDSLLCVVQFPAENALVVDGRVATHLLVEPAAQAAATHLAILAVEGGADIKGFEGFLTSAKAVTVTRPTIPADTDIHIRVRPRGKLRKPAGGLFKCTFEATLDNTPIAQGELSSYVKPLP
jgi:predicted hotdog family 3-hydroxylacyl-ACP dehydratase